MKLSVLCMVFLLLISDRSFAEDRQSLVVPGIIGTAMVAMVALVDVRSTLAVVGGAVIGAGTMFFMVKAALSH
jgi:hypothetical protein